MGYSFITNLGVKVMEIKQLTLNIGSNVARLLTKPWLGYCHRIDNGESIKLTKCNVYNCELCKHRSKDMIWYVGAKINGNIGFIVLNKELFTSIKAFAASLIGETQLNMTYVLTLVIIMKIIVPFLLGTVTILLFLFQKKH